MSPAGNDTTIEYGKTEAARQRLDVAIGRLEQAVARQREKAATSAGAAAELAAVRNENDRLAGLNKKLSTGLDNTIGRLNKVLEG